MEPTHEGGFNGKDIKAMSAFVVEDKVINGFIAYISTARGEEYTRQTILAETGADLATFEGKQKLGQAMFALNCNAVEQRYGTGEAKEFRELNYSWKETIPPALIQAYKSLRCWLYQCCEGDVPETSLLYSTMERISADMAHTIVSRLDAYEREKW